MSSTLPVTQPDVTAPVQQQPRTLFQRLSESSHPIALLFFLFFRLSALFIYIFGTLFTSNKVLLFVIIILLLAADFWNVKNVSGRLLVGLRWWNESAPDGSTIWVFETADPQRYINPIDSKVFWLLSYVTPVAWVVLILFKLSFIWLLLTAIALILSITNAVAFSRCDKFAKASIVTSGFMGSLSTGLLTRAFGGVAGRLFNR
ncbi:uncharacterized protein SAPINGB_P005304 [Magnusiomyces paraingens]|uniref:Golgi apparatus membrane protein TVP23 n=1 Tax=Magnusiomyces paraingens TaxID=2606893 RepID=A0A5E8BZA6_9ASCO|nr:uncharacterized protein SAPINGB_P005304 [Saprochaete ingens]VVT56817.1 unnamed protein product [Saprochaete ingens]